MVIDEARFPGRQGRLLFAYLVAEQGRLVPRDELAEALWGGAPPPTWEKALTVIVSKLRSLLPGRSDGASALSSAFGCYRLELPEGTWVDVIVATDAAKKAEEALAAGDLEQAKAAATLAASLVRQPFLPGEEGTWVAEKRREYADVRSRALIALADACLRSGDAPAAAKWAEQTITLAPFRETGYRRLMEAHVAAGNRAEALQVYEQCRRLLADELGTYPSPETESIYRELLEAPSDHAAAADAPADRVPPSTPEPGAPPRASRRRLVAVGVGAIAATAALIGVVLLGRGGAGPAARIDTSFGANAVLAVDSSTHRITASTPLGAAPGAIAFGEGSLWVTMPGQDSVSRIDPATNTVQQTIPVGKGPAGIAVGGGFVWVTNSLDGTVTQIDPRTRGGQVVKRITVGNRPAGVAYGLSGVWVANSIDHTVVRIDPVTGTPDRPISVEAGADAIAVGAGAVWVTSESSGVVSRLDPRSRSVIPVHVGNGPNSVAAAPGVVWVANGADGTVSRIDPATNKVTSLITVGEGPSGVATAAGGSGTWVANELAGTISRIDPAAGRVVRTVPVGGLPQGVAASADTPYVAVRESGSAHRGGTLTLVVPNPAGVYNVGFPKALDPANGYTDWELLTLTNDGLLGYGRSGGAASYKVVPDLAVTLPTLSDGGRTYSFRLRPGIRYSTGETVRPRDIRRGIERTLLLSGGELPGAYLSGIVGATECQAAPARCDLSKGIVTERGSGTVTFHLTAPDPDFVYKLALPIADAVPTGTPLRARVPLPATGPFEIADVGAKKSTRAVIRLVRNPHFRLWSAAAQPDAFPDQIIERFGYTADQAVNLVERGAADITGDGFDYTWSPALTARLRTRYSSRMYHAPAPGTTAVWLNMRVPPFDHLGVRQALNYAVDRNHLIELAGGTDVAQVGCQLLPPNTDGYRRFCPYTRHPNPAGTYSGPDLAKARRLVAASGTKGQSVTVWFYNVRIGRLNGAYFVSVLQSLGYNARLKFAPHKDSTWRPGRQAGVGGAVEDFPSANNFFSPTFSCRAYVPARLNENFNQAGFCNRRIDAEMTRARALQTSDPPAASRLWSEIDRQITLQAPWVVIRTGIAPDFVSSRTGNYTSCYVSDSTGSTGACLSQLWVR